MIDRKPVNILRAVLGLVDGEEGISAV